MGVTEPGKPGPEEDRKPVSDAAGGAFVPVGVVLGIDGDASVTSEFAIPAGLDVPAGGAESEAQTTSEFALPEGMAPPEPVATEQEGSAFSLPRTYSARHAPVAFTPPSGIPAVSLTKDVPWQDRMRTMLRMPVAERPAPERQTRAEGDSGPAVPRVLDLTLRIGELLLAGGEGAEDVEAAMFAVCRSYGLDRCEPTVTFTQLSVTHQPSLVDDPVTASRIVRRRATDYTRLAAVFQLVDDLSDPESAITLEEAYRRLAEIRRNRHPYPGWALTAASGLLAGAASVLVGGGVVVFVAAALGAMLGDRLAWLCSGRGLPEFYQFLVAAMPPAAIGVALTVTHVDVEASAVITGGLFALLPGRALVAGAHDGLTGYYITASARLLEVMYLFVGIVVGVLLVLYFGVKLGAELNPDAALGSAQRPLWQLGASMLLSLTFAVLLQQERSTVLAVTLNGGVAWAVYGAMHDAGGISPVASTAVAAGVVGLFGQLLSRYRFASALPYTTAAIGPLLPGSATYFGLLAFAQNDVDAGLVSLTKAAALAMAIAIGVNLGSELFRLFLPGAARVGRRAAKRTRGF
ncbi:threonine/serine exporter family protein [Streptomyces europaeiscabiei]|uniref:threonine/serine ThrE exporter family protein n=1 Tax=Streptomyces europaeiscabiei TaxID=146819 RepID=UPI000B18229E|nr:threonine/serine exporter family protein [Streptomyces europaeiscabiei]MDX2530363.1 threonine/serine exporter family protein [Streptomyces europaeiscabiei]MDX2758769.1 threonine/serine exporter family protein [Streptomyces europaeiscabiei]MDX3668412.1 threonine/serine exporter family protein [Streptomyces europaeiscabiei]MDX3714638.1 threonine/serine exporter family protein [Streptomyces europaeiscabiei]MDX3840971.1 threonine/serine exporter family protein [Streptomyces europaeiscabiei]